MRIGQLVSQRQTLAEILMNDWTRMNAPIKDRFFNLLSTWRIIALLDDVKRLEYLSKIQPEFVAKLRKADDHKPSQWLLAIYDHEQELASQQRAERK